MRLYLKLVNKLSKNALVLNSSSHKSTILYKYYLPTISPTLRFYSLLLSYIQSYCYFLYVFYHFIIIYQLWTNPLSFQFQSCYITILDLYNTAYKIRRWDFSRVCTIIQTAKAIPMPLNVKIPSSIITFLYKWIKIHMEITQSAHSSASNKPNN